MIRAATYNIIYLYFHRRMKKLLVILLLSVYACTQLGPSLWFYYKPMIRMMASARQRIRSALRENEDLVHIETDMQQFKKMRQGRHEILLNGLLHDIEKISIEGDRVKLVVRKDAEETSWLRFHESVSKWIKKSPRQSQASVPIAKWLLNIYCSVQGKIASDIHYTPSFNSFPGIVFIKLPISPFLPGPGQPPDNALHIQLS